MTLNDVAAFTALVLFFRLLLPGQSREQMRNHFDGSPRPDPPPAPPTRRP